MKTNLSSQIKLDRIPKKYYAPESEIESAALCREEKVYTQILETSEEGARYIANEVAETINKTVTKKGSCVITLGAGNSVVPVYTELVKLYNEKKVDFANVIVFNFSEFCSTEEGAPRTLAR